MKTKSLIMLLICLLGSRTKAGTLTNRVPITTDILFALTVKNEADLRNDFRSDELLRWGTIFPSTNYTAFRTFPRNQAFDFHLIDAAGNEVKKTSKGEEMSSPVHAPTSMSEAARLPGHLNDGYYPLFKANEVFKIPSNGIYELTIQLTLWAPTTNLTPDYEIWTHCMTSPNTNLHYGVVVSQPVRVRIIKQ